LSLRHEHFLVFASFLYLHTITFGVLFPLSISLLVPNFIPCKCSSLVDVPTSKTPEFTASHSFSSSRRARLNFARGCCSVFPPFLLDYSRLPAPRPLPRAPLPLSFNKVLVSLLSIVTTFCSLVRCSDYQVHATSSLHPQFLRLASCAAYPGIWDPDFFLFDEYRPFCPWTSYALAPIKDLRNDLSLSSSFFSSPRIPSVYLSTVISFSVLDSVLTYLIPRICALPLQGHSI